MAVLLLIIAIADSSTMLLAALPGGELAWQRDAIAAGQWWRLISAHVVHLGVVHMLMNAAALLLVLLVVGDAASNTVWFGVWLIVSIAVSLALWFFEPMLQRYVGASGVLHGLLVYGALRLWPRQNVESAIILVAVAFKLAWEQMAGPSPTTERLIAGSVIANAHLWGAVAGALIGTAGIVRAVVSGADQLCDDRAPANQDHADSGGT